MDHQHNLRIVTAGVEDARREQQARGPEVGPVDLKLTVDLSKKNLYELPEEVIDILSAEVERLQLAHNQIRLIPQSFSQCRPLKYLNLRANLFQDFPMPLLTLPQLEILDLSVNEIRAIPDNIRSMRSLRVLSLTKNKINNVPSCIKDFDTLRMLKLAGNPLRPDLASIVQAKDTQIPFDETVTDNEKETFITSSLKHYLKAEAANRSGDSSSSENPLETPRALMRNGSLRFPVKTNGNGIDSASESRSPGFSRPPIPARSHFRVSSGQNHLMQKSALRRPGLAPLNVGNERNRSNSESLLQATQNNRSKRMGIVPRKRNDLGTVTENQKDRTSFHSRGQSHASALRDWKQPANVDHLGSSNVNGYPQKHLQDIIHPVHTLIPYLVRAPKKRKRRSKPQFVDSAVGVRHSLSLFDQITNDLIQSLPSRPQKGLSRLKDAQHEASFKIASLHHSVNMLIQEGQNNRATQLTKKKASKLCENACVSAVARCIHLANLLLDQSAPILADEICHAFHPIRQIPKRTTITQKWYKSKNLPLQAAHRSLHDEPLRDESLTPTRERPVTARRIKDWSSSQQLNISNGLKPTATDHRSAAQSNVSQSTFPQPTVPLYLNGRSRSSSHADQYNILSSTDSNFALSPAMTPSSLGTFSTPGTPFNRSRSSSVATGAHGGAITPAVALMSLEKDHGLQFRFDRIYKLLEQTISHSRKALPALKEIFIRALTEAQTDLDRAHCEEWARRVRTCSLASELSGIMHKRLQAVKSPDPNTPNDKSFWELAKRFLMALSNLLQDVQAGMREGYIPGDIIALMRPVSNSTKAASHEIRDSPWKQLLPGSSGAESAASPSNSSIASNATYGHHRQRRSSGSNSYAASIPPTPLSAALGPAAQATIPSAPASSGSLERSFQGGWGERADALLQMQQTMVYRR